MPSANALTTLPSLLQEVTCLSDDDDTQLDTELFISDEFENDYDLRLSLDGLLTTLVSFVSFVL